MSAGSFKRALILLRLQKQQAGRKLLITERARNRAALQDRSRAAVRADQPPLRTRLQPDHQKPALSTETFGSERLAGAMRDRLTHHVIILEMNGDSYGWPRVAQGKPQPTPDARQPGWPFGPTRLGTLATWRARV